MISQKIWYAAYPGTGEDVLVFPTSNRIKVTITPRWKPDEIFYSTNQIVRDGVNAVFIKWENESDEMIPLDCEMVELP